VPVPRRFDRRPPERDTTRINERIRVAEVRLIGEDGAQIGVLKIDDALRYAQNRDLDLVEVAPEAKPPVCRVLDYSKYKYEQAQKVKQARKHQQQITIREIKFRPKIAQHDYDTKKGHIERFLKHKDKVKVTIMFRGREVTHPERGVMILDRLADELAELAIVEQRPIQDGRNMTMMLGPSKAVLAGQFDDSHRGEVTQEAMDQGAEVGSDGTAVAADGSAPAADRAEGAVASVPAPDGAAPTAGAGDGAAAADPADGASANGGPATPSAPEAAPEEVQSEPVPPPTSEAMAALPPRRDRQAPADAPALAEATPKSR
jgi:translation initiation factor IF-3